MGELKIRNVEKFHEQQSNIQFDQQLRGQVSSHDLGRADSLRYSILSLVVEGKYERATTEITEFIKARDKFPNFEFLAKRYVQHAMDLVNAIKVKRDFNGRTSLPVAKHQELLDRVKEHFNDLKTMLLKIEHVDYKVQREDMQTTVWVLRALSYCIGALFIIAFIVYNTENFFSTLVQVITHFAEETATWLLQKVGLY